MNHCDVFEDAQETIKRIRETQGGNIEAAASLISDAMKRGGIIQGFGSGYYLSGARELCHRVGGLMPSKIITDPSYGRLESVEGVGTELMKIVDVRPEDVVIITSHHGTAPMIIEVALEVKKKGGQLIVVTSLSGSRKLNPIHSSGTKLYEIGDVVIDNCFEYSREMFDENGKDVQVVGMSYYGTVLILQAIVLSAIEKMVHSSLGHLVIGATGSLLDPSSQDEARNWYKKYKSRTQRF